MTSHRMERPAVTHDDIRYAPYEKPYDPQLSVRDFGPDTAFNVPRWKIVASAAFVIAAVVLVDRADTSPLQPLPAPVPQLPASTLLVENH